MGIVSLENIKPGMVLAADVKERSGRVLISAKTELTEKNLHILRTWGVTEADIQGVSQEEVEAQILAQIDPKLVQEVEEFTKKVFRHTDPQNPVIRELHHLFRMNKLKSSKNWEENGNGL
ncbi:MAG: hypothetical protein U0V70_18775 [Terriglobia bacterium]